MAVAADPQPNADFMQTLLQMQAQEGDAGQGIDATSPVEGLMFPQDKTPMNERLPQLVNPGGPLTGQQSMTVSSAPKEIISRATLDDLNTRSTPALDQQVAGLKSFQDQLAAYAKPEEKTSSDKLLAGLMGVSDILGRTHYVENQIVPEHAAEEQKKKNVIALAGQYQKALNDATERDTSLKNSQFQSVREGNKEADLKDYQNRVLALRAKELAAKNAYDPTDDVKKMSDMLQKGWTMRSGQAGQVQGKINAAESAEALLAQGDQQPGGLDSRQVEELAQSTARLLGGGTQASARVDALVPHTLLGNVQSFKEWIGNKPTGQEMQAFTDRMADTIAREKQLALDQKRQYQVGAVAPFQDLKKKAPEAYKYILDSQGISPDMISEKGTYNKPPSEDEKKRARLQELLKKQQGG